MEKKVIEGAKKEKDAMMFARLIKICAVSGLLFLNNTAFSASRTLCYNPGLILHDLASFKTSKQPEGRYYLKGTAYIAYGTDFQYESSNTANMVTQASVESVADTCVASGKEICVIDIEAWPQSTEEQRATKKSRFIQLLQWFKARQPGALVGVYGESPEFNFYDACPDCTGGHGSSSYIEWKDRNDDTNFLAYADFVIPVLYEAIAEGSSYSVGTTTFPDTVAWIGYVMEEARRLAPDKPIIPFLWPIYHNSVSTLNLTITGITAATPPVVTTGTHTLQTGMEAYLSGVSGATGVNGNLYKVTRINSTTFSLQDPGTGANIDGSTLGAYSSGGSVVTVLSGTQWDKILRKLDDYTNRAVVWNLQVPSLYNWNGSADWWVKTKEYVNCL